MPTPDDRLAALAEAIADGRLPDWDTAVADAGSDEERAAVESLRAIAAIGQSQAVVPLAAEPHLANGTTWGALRILGHIGRGRFGDVYRAWDARLARDVALKILRAPSPESVSSEVVNEGRLMARVRHPNVVAIYGAERIDGRTGLWMEFVPGQTLEAELKQRGLFSSDDVLHVGIELSRALKAVHQAGLIHRDVKAHNVLRDRPSRLVLGDFGTGHELDEPVAERIGLAGTPSYVAPEIFRGAPASPQSDLYSLGVLLFHLATGGYPVTGRSIPEIREAHMRGVRQSIRARRPDLPASLMTAIDRVLDPDPARRFENAAAFEAALGPLRPWWRHGLVALGAAVLLVAGIAAGVVWARRDASPGGLALTEIDRALQLRATIRSPSANSRIATCSAFGRQSVALCDLVTGTMTEVRAPAARGEIASASFLSPDGKTIAYVWTTVEANTSVSSIRLIGADGQNDRELRRQGPGDRLGLLKWTRDGRALVMLVGSPDQRMVLLSASGGPEQELWRLPAGARRPDLSPDEQSLVYVQPATGLRTRDIVLADRRTGQVTPLTNGPLDDARPVFTSDGRSLVFMSDRSGSRGLYLQRIQTGLPVGEAILLRDFGRSDVEPLPVASADGTMFLRIRQDTMDVYRATLDLDRLELRQPERVEAHSIDDSAGADWSPDGRRFAYASGCVFRVTPCENRLRIKTIDGRPEREVPITPAILPRSTRVRWSPDGNLIALRYDAPEPGPPTTLIDLVDLRDGTARRLAEVRNVIDIRWDSTSAALYSVRPGEVGRVDAITGQSSTHYHDPHAVLSDMSTFDVRADGSLLLMTRTGGKPVVRVRQPDGQTMDHPISDMCYALAWGPGGRTILYSLNKGPGTPFDLWMMPASGGDARQIKSSVPDIGDISIHPDGRQVLFSAGNPRTFVWTLSGLPR